MAGYSGACEAHMLPGRYSARKPNGGVERVIPNAFLAPSILHAKNANNALRTTRSTSGCPSSEFSHKKAQNAWAAKVSPSRL